MRAGEGTAQAELRGRGTEGLRTACLRRAGEFEALAEEWDGLLARMARPSPFLSFTWQETWWRHFGGRSELMLVIARSPSGELLGLAPLHIVRRRVAGLLPVRSLELIGYRGSAVCADHLDFLAPAEMAEEVVAALVEEILRRAGMWDVMVLGGLAEDSLVPGLWRQRAPAGMTHERLADICYFRRLPADTPALWGEIKRDHSKLASNVKYYRKRLSQQHEVRLIAPVPADAVATTLEELARLHTLAHGRKGQSGNFGREDYLGFHRELLGRLASDPGLYLARLDCDGHAAAILYGYFLGGVLYYYQSGFDPALGGFGVGTLLLAEVFEDAITRLRAREFDFLRGAEAYKTRWTATARHTRDFWAWGPGLTARFDAMWQGARRRAAAWRARGRGAVDPIPNV